MHDSSAKRRVHETPRGNAELTIRALGSTGTGAPVTADDRTDAHHRPGAGHRSGTHDRPDTHHQPRVRHRSGTHDRPRAHDRSDARPPVDAHHRSGTHDRSGAPHRPDTRHRSDAHPPVDTARPDPRGGPAAWLRALVRRCAARVDQAEFGWYPAAPFAPDLAGAAGPWAARLVEWNGPL